MPAVILAAPGPVFQDPNQQAVQANATLVASGSSIFTGYGVSEVSLFINVKSAPTGTTPTLQYTIQEVDPGDGTTVIGSTVSSTVINAVGIQRITLESTFGGSLKVSWVVAGASASFTGVYATLVGKAASTKITDGTHTASVSSASALKVDGSAVTQPVSETTSTAQNALINPGDVVTLAATGNTIMWDVNGLSGGQTATLTFQVSFDGGITYVGCLARDLSLGGAGTAVNSWSLINMTTTYDGSVSTNGRWGWILTPMGATHVQILLGTPTGGAVTLAYLAASPVQQHDDPALMTDNLGTYSTNNLPVGRMFLGRAGGTAPSSILLDANGNVQVVGKAVDGAPVIDAGLLVSGKDGSGDARLIKTASDGTVRVDPTGTTTQPVSAASLPLPTGAATSANQVNLGGQTTEINDGTHTASIKPASTAAVAGDTALVVAISPNIDGQKTMANSIPVVVASDQSVLPVVGQTTSNPGASPASLPTLGMALVDDALPTNYNAGELRPTSMTSDGRIRVATSPIDRDFDFFGDTPEYVGSVRFTGNFIFIPGART
jgi:hypothetical protein